MCHYFFGCFHAKRRKRETLHFFCVSASFDVADLHNENFSVELRFNDFAKTGNRTKIHLLAFNLIYPKRKFVFASATMAKICT